MNHKQAMRHVWLARTFTAEQLEVLEQMQVCQTDMLTIAEIKNAGVRDAVVTLIRAGVEPAVAIQRMRLIHGPGLAGDSTSNSSMNNIRFLEESHALAQRAWFELSKQYYDEVLDQLKRISLQLKSIDKKLGAR